MLLRFYLFLKSLPQRLAVTSGPILRLLAAICLLVAIIAFVSDWEAARPATSTAGYWQQFSPASFANAGKAITRTLGAWVWSPLMSSLLALPAYLLFAILALTLGYAGRRRRRVSVYLN